MPTPTPERLLLLAAGSLVFGTAMIAAPAHAADVPFGVRATPRPVPAHLKDFSAGPREPTAAGVAKSNVFYLNYDGASISFTGQEDDSSQNISQFQEFAGNYVGYGGGAKRAASFQAVQVDWAPYNVVITDQRPGGGNYTMCVNSPTNPYGGGVLGIAPLDCNDGQARNIVFAFHSDSDDFPAATQATTMSQEIAHSYGLEHVQQPNDIMNPYNAGGDPAFLDQCLALDAGGGQILCNQQHNQFCNGSQNSNQELLWLFGSATPDTSPPSVTITSPASGAMFEDGASFTITAEASDDVAVTEVQLFNNGQFLQSDNTGPYSWDVDNIPAGNYCFKASARDIAGNIGDSAEVCVTAVQGADPTTDPTTDPTGNPTTSPPTTDPNTSTTAGSESDSDSLTGGGDDTDGNETGDVPTEGGLPDSPGVGGTLPGLPPDYGLGDDSGCSIASQPVPMDSLTSALGLFALALVGRRRRR